MGQTIWTLICGGGRHDAKQVGGEQKEEGYQKGGVGSTWEVKAQAGIYLGTFAKITDLGASGNGEGMGPE